MGISEPRDDLRRRVGGALYFGGPWLEKKTSKHGVDFEKYKYRLAEPEAGAVDVGAETRLACFEPGAVHPAWAQLEEEAIDEDWEDRLLEWNGERMSEAGEDE